MKKALLSVSDKTGLLEFAQFLVSQKIELISTGGTAKLLREHQVPVMEISDYTGFPEMMEGRVKTLHPKVHGGLLHLRDNPEHVAQAQEHHIDPIDLVIVNLYPFEQTLAKAGVQHHELIENIDIGGPSMLRSAAKNYRSVTVVVDAADYPKIQAEMTEHGDTLPETREKLAAKVFRHTSHYDSLIGHYLTSVCEKENPVLQETSGVLAKKAQSLRYGENPHQQAALYGSFHRHFHQIHGKELSYNNIIDISAAVQLIADFAQEKESILAILKHTNPCGVGAGNSLLEAWNKAYATDKQAPFGGIIIVNQALDLPVAEAIAEIFSEVIIAPSFLPDAAELLKKKKNLRLIENNYIPPVSAYDMKSVTGGLLIQESDLQPVDFGSWKVVTKRQPTAEELKALGFGWRIVKHVKSNAIVYAGSDRTLGIGAGQMSRVDSSRIAVWKAGEAGLKLQGSVIASDAFFPFADGILAAAQAGAVAAR
jgi:phosphoribosylaminoimidazolecarboxamide formyltransferase / IMP cyclohydrolase